MKTVRVLVCSYPGIFADTVIKALQEYQAIEIVGLVYSERIFSAHESWIGGAIRMLKTSGINYAVMQFMQTDLYLLLKYLRFCVSLDRQIPVITTKDINSPMGLSFIKSLNADVLLLANFNQKVSSAVISSPTIACLNIHPSTLPNFKGVDPVFAALYAGEKKLGVTVHLVDDNFDTGDIIDQAMIPTDENRSVFNHQVHLFQHGGKLAANVIKTLPQSIEKLTKNIGGNYDSWPTKAKIKSFKKRGKSLIKPIEYISALKSLFIH